MSAPRTYHAEAVALSTSPFSERDRLLTIYTRQSGKLRVLAKGARRTTSKLAAHVDLLVHSRLFLHHGRTFDQVTQGTTVETFPQLRQDLWRSALAVYCAELMERFTEEGQTNPGLFDALLVALRRLDDPALDTAVSVRAFELDLLGLSGYRPQLHRCVGCQAIIEPVTNSFSAAEGGVLCPACAAQHPGALPIGVDALKLLRNLQTRQEAIVGHARVAPVTVEAAEHILIGYIQYLLDRRIRSVGFLDVVRRMHPAQTQERGGARE